ncbi:hypothetical protein SAMN04489761_3454 [Tenacibaculum sp. MAR_2009_124]|uniref:hypothetical protein n=1 Tax=Tenacibaculum sp. MAR_2009_124 TaxID=1250059 RepID=UPI000896B7C0|nr:hypothetical protein [Tenacibaculum sp. MAR_2009_124]SEC66948.1 hypothetical protein SAMN04489761_3454 [Tenacibaculum sp. MAR_2009_124]
MTKSDIEKKRADIAKAIESEIKRQGIAIEEIERKSISKRIIYNIIQGKGYTIDSLIQVIEVLKKSNNSFNINV